MGARTAVLEAAEQLMAEKGAHAASIAALSSASGVSNGSIYHHFGSKEGVLDALLSRYVSELHDRLMAIPGRLPDTPREAVRQTVREQLDWSETNRTACQLLAEHGERLHTGDAGPLVQQLNATYVEACRSWLDRQADAGRLPTLGVELAHAIVFAPAREVVGIWLAKPDFPAPTSFAEALGDAAWYGLLAADPTFSRASGQDAR